MAKILKQKSEEFQKEELGRRYWDIKVCGGLNSSVVLVTMIVLCEMKNDSVFERC